MLERVWRKGKPLECKLIRPQWRTVWGFLRKLKIELPYDPAIPLLGIYPEKTELERHRQANLHCSSITIAKIWKQPKSPSTDGWTKKNWYMYRWNISYGKK